MKFSMIVNPGTLMRSDFAFNYPRHLVLAQVLDGDRQYASVVAKLVNEGREVILDNGAHEGVDVNLATYMSLVRDLNPTCVVLPDLVGRPSVDNQKRCMSFAKKLQWYKGTLMYLAQGQSDSEILEGYDWAIGNLDPKRYIIGFGEAYHAWGEGESSRIEMVSEVFKNEMSDLHHYHIFGGRWHATDWFSRHTTIVTIDSFNPCGCALGGVCWPTCIRTGRLLSTHQTADEAMLRRNVRKFEEAYGCEVS